jgi:hypothetical protein
MAEKESRYGSFFSENIAMERLYRLACTGLCLRWRAIPDLIAAQLHKLLTAFLFAFAVSTFHDGSDLGRVDLEPAKTGSQS